MHRYFKSLTDLNIKRNLHLYNVDNLNLKDNEDYDQSRLPSAPHSLHWLMMSKRCFESFSTLDDRIEYGNIYEQKPSKLILSMVR